MPAGVEGTSSGGSNLANIINWGNQAAMSWYATVTQKPIQSPYPQSTMRDVFGTDFSGGPTIEGQTFGTLGPLLLFGLLVTGVVLLVRR